MWRLAKLCFVVALVAMLAAPAWAETPGPVGGYTWTQVVVLVGIGAAWGDMRRQVADLRRDFDDFRKESQ